MFTRVDHVEINANDLDETVRFYTDVLGFTLQRRLSVDQPARPGSDGSGYRFEMASLTLGDFMIEVFPSSAAQPKRDALGPRIIALRVHDMATAVAALRARGVTIASEPRASVSFHGLRAEIVDPNGVHIELREWQRGDHYANAAWQPDQPGVTLHPPKANRP